MMNHIIKAASQRFWHTTGSNGAAGTAERRMFDLLVQVHVVRGAMLSGPSCQSGTFVPSDNWVGNNDEGNALAAKGAHLARAAAAAAAAARSAAAAPAPGAGVAAWARERAGGAP
jgi:hypothetical protein